MIDAIIVVALMAIAIVLAIALALAAVALSILLTRGAWAVISIEIESFREWRARRAA